MPSLLEIESLTKLYSDALTRLNELLVDARDELEKTKRAHLAKIKPVMERVAERRADLRAAVEGSAALFVKPRTIIFHGIKVGFEKGKGKIEWPNEQKDAIVKLIKKNFPDQAEVLIKVTEKPIKKALANLSAADLKKLGITVTDSGEFVVIKAVAGDIEKMVLQFIKSLENADESEEE